MTHPRPLAQRVVVVPARWAASRLPGKPLADLGGLPMVEHVRRRAQMAAPGVRVVVATDDVRIAQAVEHWGGEVVQTGACASGTDRVYAALRQQPVAHVVNVQGDLPLVEPEHVSTLFSLLESGAEMATLACPFSEGEDLHHPALVKVAVDPQGWAVGFSRAPLPGAESLHHIGLYGFAWSALERFVALPPGRAEQRERLEQLRWTEAGRRIRVGRVVSSAPGIDTPEQLAALQRRFDTGELAPPSLC